MECEPAYTIINLLGGATKVAAFLKTTRQAVWKWTWPRQKGGTGGLVPQRHHPAILALARQQGVYLTAEHFLPGGAVATAKAETVT